jgi:antitoxin component YwqK of YwqJK toxin-antitoxin module
MRILSPKKAGSIGRGTLLVLALLVAGLGLTLYFLPRPPRSPSDAAGAPTVSSEVSRTNLVLVNGRLRLSGASNEFSGLMLEHYAEGSLRSRSAVTNGLLHGLSQGWFTNGQMQISENFKEGVSHGLRTKWYADGAKQSEASIVAGKIHGSFRRWHPNGALAEQAEFVMDQPEGPSVAYFPSGYLKARVVMKDGKPVEQTFWKDGERKE